MPRFVDRVRGNVIEWEEVEGDTWSKQCRRSSEVQKSVASLVSHSSGFRWGFSLMLSCTGYNFDARYGDPVGFDDGVLGIAE